MTRFFPGILYLIVLKLCFIHNRFKAQNIIILFQSLFQTFKQKLYLSNKVQLFFHDILPLFLLGVMSGTDDQGTTYTSIDQMWENQLRENPQLETYNHIGSKSRWYQIGGHYWNDAKADYDGVTGGFESLSERDLSFSQIFLTQTFKKIGKTHFGDVLDCGAGIGRIAKELLCPLFKTIDIVDQCEKYIQKAKEILKEKNIRHFYCKGLQDFTFKQKYDCIWVQWVLMYLNDEDGVSFLRKAKKNLKQGGVIIVKDNASDEGFVVDKSDCSVIRSHLLWLELFSKADLQVINEGIQPDWPEDMYDLRMYALI